jgi:low temperature requirement protein LtrA
MWWLYFERRNDELLTTLRHAFTWGYGHYFVWAAAAAVGAGLAITIDQAQGEAVIGAGGAGASVAIPLAIYVLGVWVLLDLPYWSSRSQRVAGLVAAAAILLTPLTAQPVLLAGLVMAALITFKVAIRERLAQP